MLSKDQVEFKAKAPERIEERPQQLRGIRVLLVEDSPDNQILIRLLLEKHGARLTIASDGHEGVRLATSEEFDIVLMDIQMPNMDGHEATRQLRSLNYRKPIVALTAHAMKEEAERAAQSGFTAFLSKPIQRDALISSVASMCNPRLTDPKSLLVESQL